MKECFRCRSNETEAILMKAISKQGMVYVCNRCQIKERLPLIKEGGKVEDSKARMSVRQRLEIMAGVKPKEISERNSSRTVQHMGEEIRLDDLVEKNFQEKVKHVDKKAYSEMIPNFHWVVMRKRRIEKMTQSELAEKIAEPVSAVQALERGVLPADYLPLVRKVEKFLGIYLMKEPHRDFVPAEIVHESKIPSGVTIGDLRKMHSKEASKKKIFEEPVSEENYSEDDELTPEEMERIIFQRD